MFYNLEKSKNSNFVFKKIRTQERHIRNLNVVKTFFTNFSENCAIKNFSLVMHELNHYKKNIKKLDHEIDFRT